MWHCPHCGAPQAETARCWVCRRSSTTCSTCRHFRGSLAADLGYCALDRKRLPLTGLELRGCWTAPRAAVASALPGASAGVIGATSPGAASVRERPDAVRARGFVPVEDVLPIAPPVEDPVAPPAPVLDVLEGWQARTNLFGDLEA
jgi:hypothetical protein